MIKQIKRESLINVFDLRQLHKQYWKQCDIKNSGTAVVLEGLGKEWTFEQGEVKCLLANLFHKDYKECTDYWLFTHGSKIEQACEWYQKFKTDYPQFNTQLQYHEFSQSIIPHCGVDSSDTGNKQCKLNYVALGNSEDYTHTPDGNKIVHVPGLAYLIDTGVAHSMVASDKNIFLSVLFHHPFEEVATQLEVI